jgi:TonB family protein
MRLARLLLLPVMLSVSVAPSLAQPKSGSKTTMPPAPSATAVASPLASPTAVPETPSPSFTLDLEKIIYRPGSEGIEAPLLIKRVEPKYPKKARKAKKEGVVILEGVVDRDGIVRDILVLRSVDPLLDAAAKEALEQWRYRPATMNGDPVRVYVTARFTFNLTQK